MAIDNTYFQILATLATQIRVELPQHGLIPAACLSYPDVLVYLSLHSIKRKGAHIDKAINMLKLSKTDSVVSVQEERDPIFKYTENVVFLGKIEYEIANKVSMVNETK